MPLHNKTITGVTDEFSEFSPRFEPKSSTFDGNSPSFEANAAPQAATTAPGYVGGRVGFAVGVLLAEAAAVSAGVIGALLWVRAAAHADFTQIASVGPATVVMLLGLPLFNALFLTSRRYYTRDHLLSASVEPLRLTVMWLEAFGAAVVAATLVRAVEPIRLHHFALFGRELAAMFGAGLAMLLLARRAWVVVRPRLSESSVPRLRFIGALQGDLPRLNRTAMAQKRAFDLVLGCFILIAILPLMALIALLIGLDSSGPVLFRQTRVGRGGVLFDILKFRTMAHAPTRDGAESVEDFDTLQTQRDDRRITRLGVFLRRHSLDELPQIFNVLAGDMSIIGPRPHAAAMTIEGVTLEHMIPDYPARFAVRPGITGWAQINGRRGIIDDVAALQARLDLDLYYIANWSPGFDVAILVRTVACIMRDDQAF